MTMGLAASRMDFLGSPNGAGGFPNPFNDVASLAMPVQNRNALEWCLVPGTVIQLANGTPVPIEEVAVGDEVLTRGHTVELVERLGVRQVSESIVKIGLSGMGLYSPLRLTDSHNVFRLNDAGQDERVPAGEIRVGDWMWQPVLPLSPTPVAARFNGWLLGLYVAEGCTTVDGNGLVGARFTLGAKDEENGILGRLLDEIDKAVSQRLTAYHSASRPDVRLVTVHDPELPEWLLSRSGKYARTKQLDSQVFQYSRETILNILGGWLDGDGWVDLRPATATRPQDYSGVWGCTTSRALGYQLQQLAQMVGLSPSLVIIPTKGFAGRTPTGARGFSYNLRFTKTDCEVLVKYSLKLQKTAEEFGDRFAAKFSRSDVRFQDNRLYRKVKAVSREDYTGPVYNFRVANDHSYIANGVIVANCEFVHGTNSYYRSAVDRIIAYFLTSVEIGALGRKPLGEDEREKFDNFLNDDLDICSVLQNLLRDWSCYGNSFSSVLVGFRRMLMCPKCYFTAPLREVHEKAIYKFSWRDFQFLATCPHCQNRGAWIVDDRLDTSSSSLKVKRWNVHEIEIVHDPYTDEKSYIWRIPEEYKRLLRQGSLYHLERASLQVLEAVKHNHLFLFAPGVIHHMMEPTLCGFRNRGWGVSRTLTNFRQVYYVQVLRRYNEAIALDYVVPFRLLTPVPRGGSGGAGGAVIDPMLSMDMGAFMPQVRAMLNRRRRDPASWHTLPFPVQYQALGGDATQLAPRDLLDQGTEDLLNAIGTPVEMYKGTMSLQSMPGGLRLFESQHRPMVHLANMFLTWLLDEVCNILQWEKVRARLKRVTLADDINRQMMIMQLMMGRVVSQSTGLQMLGLEFKDEQRSLAEEQRFTAEQQAEIQEEMQQSSFGEQMAKGQSQSSLAQAAGGGQAAPAGGGGGGGGGDAAAAPPTSPVDQMMASRGSNPSITPDDMLENAEGLANDLLGLPAGQRRSELQALKGKDEALWHLVKGKMSTIRSQARSSGQQQVLQQAGMQ